MSDKKVLLITTGNNFVKQQLGHFCGRCFLAVDCSDMKRRDLLQYLRNISYDILITYRCPYILPPDIIERAAVSAFNIHPSLLPAYAGLNPWEEMIRNNERIGGVTFHILTDKVDQGRIIKSQSFDMDFNLGVAFNRNKADELAGMLVGNVLIDIIASEKTKTNMIMKHDGVQ